VNILFVCSSLGHGGLSHEVEATARLALASGHAVEVFTPYKVREDALIRRRLGERLAFDSAQEQWRRSVRGRLLFGAARLRLIVRQRRRPSAREEVHLARRFVPGAERADFWDVQAGRILIGRDLVHLFGKPKPFLATTARQARARGLRVIYEEASQVTPEYAARADHQDFVASSHLCDVIIVRCNRHAEHIRRHYHYRGQTRVIEQWAYDSESDLLAIDRTAGAPRRGCTFGIMGRLDEGKGVEVVLDAFALVRRRGHEARLRVAGAGDAEGALRARAAALQLGNAIEFLGDQQGLDKVAFYSSLDAFVIASESEGGPITGVEAMAAALPIISTPVGAMPERLCDGSEGLFVAVDDVEGLAAAMHRLLEHPQLRPTLGGAARQRYLVRNHSRVCAPRKIALWDELGRNR
jgi:glycosyltransferase involved in cell wall biosynthesis